MIRLIIWTLERVTELSLAVLFSLFLWGPIEYSHARGIPSAIYIRIVLILFFYIASGYVFSTLILGLFIRRRGILIHSAVMALAFLVQFTIFALLSGGGVRDPFLTAALGTMIVILAAFVGTLAHSRLLMVMR